MNDSLGSRLRRHRQRRQLTLADVSERTKIGIAHLRSLERDDVSQFPPGIFRRSFVRSYAEAVGLDPDEVVADFLAQFPEPDGLTPAESAAKLPGGAQPASKARSRSTPPMRLVLADETAALGSRLTTVPFAQRAQAVGVDLGIVAACAACAWLVAHAFWAPLAVIAVAYYSLSTALLGNTVGGATAARRADRLRVGGETSAEDRRTTPSRLANPFAASLDSDLPPQDSQGSSQVPA